MCVMSEHLPTATVTLNIAMAMVLTVEVLVTNFGMGCVQEGIGTLAGMEAQFRVLEYDLSFAVVGQEQEKET